MSIPATVLDDINKVVVEDSPVITSDHPAFGAMMAALQRSYPTIPLPSSWTMTRSGNGYSGPYTYFRAGMPIPSMFQGNLFNELSLELGFNPMDPVKSAGWSYATSVAWQYVHPGGGQNGKTFAYVWSNADGTNTQVEARS